MIDGTVARKTGSVSKSGAILDSIADVVFVLCAGIKLIPVFIGDVTIVSLIVIAAIALIKVVGYMVGAIRFKQFVSMHTISNKIAGGALFLLLYTVLFMNPQIGIYVICVIALIAAMEELACLVCMKECMPDTKSVICMWRSSKEK